MVRLTGVNSVHGVSLSPGSRVTGGAVGAVAAALGATGAIRAASTGARTAAGMAGVAAGMAGSGARRDGLWPCGCADGHQDAGQRYGTPSHPKPNVKNPPTNQNTDHITHQVIQNGRRSLTDARSLRLVPVLSVRSRGLVVYLP
jgi:hypothetical protein